MKSAAEEKKARTSMSSTFGSVMNPDADRDFKQSLNKLMKQKANFVDDDQEVVSQVLLSKLKRNLFERATDDIYWRFLVRLRTLLKR